MATSRKGNPTKTTGIRRAHDRLIDHPSWQEEVPTDSWNYKKVVVGSNLSRGDFSSKESFVVGCKDSWVPTNTSGEVGAYRMQNPVKSRAANMCCCSK